MQTAFIYCALSLLLFSQFGFAEEYEAFTEPHQEIEIAAPDLDILRKLSVAEGDTVKKGQVLAVLDTRVLEAGLAIAKRKKSSYGQLNAAKAIAKLKQQRVSRLTPLLARGNAQPYEVNEARIELESANAEVKAAREALAISELEYKQIQAQIAQRTLRSPIAGVVTVVLRDEAELVGGNQAHILTVAQLNPLKIAVPVPTATALALKKGQTATVNFPYLDFPATAGNIAQIAPVTDVGSDTVKVTVVVQNPKLQLPSGVKCVVSFTEE